MAQEKKEKKTPEITSIVVNGETVLVKDLEANHIIEWCKEHDEVAWLKGVCSKKYKVKRYPRIKVENGEGKMVSKADKTQEPTIKEEEITFVKLKTLFLRKFYAKAFIDKEPSFLDIIDSL